VEAVVGSALTVSPATLNLGTFKADSPLTRRVVLKGTRPFRVLAVEGTGDGIELGADPSPEPSAVQTVTFKCQPPPGEFHRVLKIKTSLQDDPVALTIEGTATR